ncbi:acetyltransferase, GNAT family protein [Besnoitia besnoiti]|uniref:Acetyltransferase, GNAT family protein n=1 Tax=Besnoitia besnoiti TaxID=94643 RepID=A0A2A9MG94_BESBE|nr:acetyltransferase, GNAT family protein [Besnoitia besnoiti]PFH37528.1 acetyltransferase, GNAT family protein [Besnoitia besnoiti]
MTDSAVAFADHIPIFCVRLGHQERHSIDSSEASTQEFAAVAAHYCDESWGATACPPLAPSHERTRLPNEPSWHSAPVPSEHGSWRVIPVSPTDEGFAQDRRGFEPPPAAAVQDLREIGDNLAETWIRQASDLLTAAWPSLRTRTAAIPKQRERLSLLREQEVTAASCSRENHEPAALKQFLFSSAPTPQSCSGYSLPCSFLMVAGGSVVGHARLQACSLPGLPAQYVAVTYVVVDTRARKKGWGKLLMHMVETIASVQLKADYVALWTRAAMGFYLKLGYQQCPPMEVASRCLASLSSCQQETLISTLTNLMKRRDLATGLRDQGSVEGRSADPVPHNLVNSIEDTTGGKDVWLRKRVGPCIAEPEHFPLAQRSTEVAAALDVLTRGSEAALTEASLADCHVSPSLGKSLLPSVSSSILHGATHDALQEVDATIGHTKTGWAYRLLNAPWCRQIGPSCGISALCMACAFLAKARQSSGREDDQNLTGRGREMVDLGEHLLHLSRERGISTDGEFFNISDLVRVAREGAHLDAVLVEFASGSEPEGFEGETVEQERGTEEKLVLRDSIWDQCAAFVRRGWLLIVPYDSEGGRPALRRGLKAHYGIVVGYAFRQTQRSLTGSVEPVTPSDPPEAGSVANAAGCHTSGSACRNGGEKLEAPRLNQRRPRHERDAEPNEGAGLEELRLRAEKDTAGVNAPMSGKAIVLQHGRSRLLTASLWSDLKDSNTQLWNGDTRTFPHAVKMDLRNKAVLVRGILGT